MHSDAGSLGRRPPKALMFSLEEYAARLARARERMAEAGLDLLVLTEPEDIFYLTAHQTVGAPQVRGERVRAS